MKLFITDIVDKKCGGCNWECSTYYGIGKNLKDARNNFEEREEYGLGLCAHCMCELINNERYGITY